MSYKKNIGSGFHDSDRHQYGSTMQSLCDALLDYRMTPFTMDPIQSALFGGGFSNSYCDPYQDFTDDESDDDGDDKDRGTYCGFRNRFLMSDPPKQASFISPHFIVPPRLKTQEEADRIAKELEDEEQKLKDRAEKKRLKKMRQKERKRQERLKEGDGDVKNAPETSSPNASTVRASADGHVPSSRACSVSPDPEPLSQRSSGTPVPLRSTALTEEPVGEMESDESGVKELEELDMTSCFVAKAASIVQRKLEQKPKPERKGKKKTEGKEEPQEGPRQNGRSDPEEVIATSIRLGDVANKLAGEGDFVKAVTFFTDAIKYNPTDFRLFGNRSFCYEKMQQYEKSLTDADISLTMNPNWIKGLYRKGKALVGLKRYSEAALVFKEVLKQDSRSADAARELMTVQIMQLMDMGFSREQSTNALIICGTVEKALEVLSSIPETTKPCTSAEEEWVVSEKKKAPSACSSTTRPKASAKTSPVQSQRQPELFPIWVGNLVPSISENTIRDVFNSAGVIHSVKLLHDRRCAFVNYTRKADCERAIRGLNAMVLEGTTLSVRYPDNIYTHLGVSKAAVTAGNNPPISGAKSSGECFQWRGKGCNLKNCIFKHVPEHKGIDGSSGKAAT